MALTILNEQYPPRKPKLTLTADSLDELPTEGVAEGSTATVGGTVYSYDSNAGWIEPGSGGGSGGGVFLVTFTDDDLGINVTADKTAQEILQASKSRIIMGRILTNGSFQSMLGLVSVPNEEEIYAEFIAWDISDSGYATKYTLDKSGTVTVNEYAWAIT